MIIVNSQIRKGANFKVGDTEDNTLFENADLSNSTFNETTFSINVNFDKTNFTNSNFINCSFIGAVMGSRGCYFGDANFTNCKFLVDGIDQFPTKQSFINAVGEDKINSGTIWIDGTPLIN